MNRLAVVYALFVASMAFAAAEESSMFQIIRNRNTEAARRMAMTKENLEERDVHGRTPLMLAAQEGNLQIVRIIVEAGSDIDAIDHKGFTAKDLLESMLRRISQNSEESKKKRIEQMRREGFSEDVIRKDIELIESSASGLPRDPEHIAGLRDVLSYLKRAKGLQDK